MGRHSRGSGEGIPPAELPEPAGRHPYAPRSQDDTGDRDRQTYRVVDVGLPPGAPEAAGFPLDGSSPLRSVPGAAPSRYGAGGTGRAPEPERRGGSTRADRHDRYGSRPDPRPPADAPRFGATRADLTAAQFRGGPDPADRRYDTNDAGEQRFGGSPNDAGEQRFGATRADLVETRVADGRLAPPALDPAETRFAAERAERFGATRADLAGPRFGTEPEPRPSTRAESLGSTALAPRPEQAPDRDEVTDTGARRTRSTFRLAETTEAHETDLDGEDDDEEHHEQGLLLQWGIFFAETLTGAAAGLGVWLGFYRLWSTWPFYAAPGVGVAAIVMLVLARTLRRRHGHELDLLTAIVTFGIITVLTVLPAAFTLRGVQ